MSFPPLLMVLVALLILWPEVLEEWKSKFKWFLGVWAAVFGVFGAAFSPLWSVNFQAKGLKKQAIDQDKDLSDIVEEMIRERVGKRSSASS